MSSSSPKDNLHQTRTTTTMKTILKATGLYYILCNIDRHWWWSTMHIWSHLAHIYQRPKSTQPLMRTWQDTYTLLSMAHHLMKTSTQLQSCALNTIALVCPFAPIATLMQILFSYKNGHGTLLHTTLSLLHHCSHLCLSCMGLETTIQELFTSRTMLYDGHKNSLDSHKLHSSTSNHSSSSHLMSLIYNRTITLASSTNNYFSTVTKQSTNRQHYITDTRDIHLHWRTNFQSHHPSPISTLTMSHRKRGRNNRIQYNTAPHAAVQNKQIVIQCPNMAQHVHHNQPTNFIINHNRAPSFSSITTNNYSQSQQPHSSNDEEEESSSSSNSQTHQSCNSNSITTLTTSSEKQEFTVLRNTIKQHISPLLKFLCAAANTYDKRLAFNKSPNSLCGIVLRKCNLLQNNNMPDSLLQQWWTEKQKRLNTQLTLHRNNIIKTIRKNYKGKSPSLLSTFNTFYIWIPPTLLYMLSSKSSIHKGKLHQYSIPYHCSSNTFHL